jgi:hypothetical protein
VCDVNVAKCNVFHASQVMSQVTNKKVVFFLIIIDIDMYLHYKMN